MLDPDPPTCQMRITPDILKSTDCPARIKDQVGNVSEILKALYAYKVLFLPMAQFILLLSTSEQTLLLLA